MTKPASQQIQINGGISPPPKPINQNDLERKRRLDDIAYRRELKRINKELTTY